MKRRWRWQFVMVLAVMLGAGATLSVLYFFPPVEHSFYPRCMVRSLTGESCWGCGGLRAMHQLLHGNWWTAWQLNPGITIALPLVICAALALILRNGMQWLSSQMKGKYV